MEDRTADDVLNSERTIGMESGGIEDSIKDLSLGEELRVVTEERTVEARVAYEDCIDDRRAADVLVIITGTERTGCALIGFFLGCQARISYLGGGEELLDGEERIEELERI